MRKDFFYRDTVLLVNRGCDVALYFRVATEFSVHLGHMAYSHLSAFGDPREAAVSQLFLAFVFGQRHDSSTELRKTDVGNYSAPFRNAQALNFCHRTVSNPARGRRFALARRLLGAFLGEDLPAPALAKRLGKDKKQVYRYERGDDRAPEATVDAFVALLQRSGLPITASWLERGEADLPPLVVPGSALVEVRRTRPSPKRPVPSPAQKVKKQASGTRR